MFTSNEVVQLVGIGASTLRRYVKTFGEKFSPEATRRRNRRFTQHDYDTVLKIKNMYDAGFSADEIRARLKAYQEEETEFDIKALVPRIAEELTTIAGNQRKQDEYNQRWEEYHRKKYVYENLGFWEKRRTKPPEPPE